MIEKILERLEEVVEFENYGKPMIYLEDAQKIVQEVAKEYSHRNSDLVIDSSHRNGWISCSERLPEKDGYYLITMQYYHLHNPVVMGCNFEDGEWWKIDKDDEVLAWMELPAPYQKGE